MEEVDVNDSKKHCSAKIFCCGCQSDVAARLTNGKEIYPHREDVVDLPFWICDVCKNYVGCHHKTSDRTKPLGCIPTYEIRRERMLLHGKIDPIWKSGLLSRSQIYKQISLSIGYDFHVANTRTMEDLTMAIKIVEDLELS